MGPSVGDPNTHVNASDGLEFTYVHLSIRTSITNTLCLERQEGWLSPTERESVSAISLRHIIWLYVTRVTPVCRCL